MLELYIANKNYSSWSLRPWLLLKQLNIPFTEHLTPFAQQGNFARFRTFSPSGKVPCLVDGNQVVWDSLAITEYLYENHNYVWPQDKSASRNALRLLSPAKHLWYELCSQGFIAHTRCGVKTKYRTTI